LGFLVDAGDCSMSADTSQRIWIARPVTEDDLDQVLEVYRQCEDFLALGPQPKASMEMVQADFRRSVEENGSFYGLYDIYQGKMIGVVDFVMRGFEGRVDQAFLSLLMIAAPYRSRGIGSEVVGWVETQVASQPDITSILAGVQINNPAAIRFWERMGYTKIRGPEVLPDTTAVFTFRKGLRPVR
jgi:ribosomal protein S18 acetylase RimI-like enzyme